MKMKNKEKIVWENYAYTQKGITLVALVITIIIMLILAAVVLYLTIGNKGLIGQAKKSVEEYKQAEANEQIKLEELYGSILIATDDDAQVTMSVADLRSFIKQEVNNEIQSMFYPTNTLDVTAFTDTTTEQTYTIPHSGWLYIEATRNANAYSILFFRNNMRVFGFNGAGNSLGKNSTYIPVKQGDIIKKQQNATGFATYLKLYY